MPDLAVDLLVAAMLLITIITAVCWLISGQVVRRPKPDPPDTPEDHRLPTEYVTFTSQDGIELGGYLTGLERPGRPVVVFCSGANGSLDRDTWLVHAFIKAGLAVLQFDWRGHGISSGKRVTLGIHEQRDLLAALDYVQSCGARRIGLLGFSMGASVALHTAAADQRINCVAADSPIVRIEDALTGILQERTKLPHSLLVPFGWLITRFVELRAGVHFRSADVVQAAARISKPVALVFGTRDQLIPKRQREKLIAACDGATVWLVEEAGHRSIYKLERNQYQERIVGFFKSALFNAPERD